MLPIILKHESIVAFSLCIQSRAPRVFLERRTILQLWTNTWSTQTFSLCLGWKYFFVSVIKKEMSHLWPSEWKVQSPLWCDCTKLHFLISLPLYHTPHCPLSSRHGVKRGVMWLCYWLNFGRCWAQCSLLLMLLLLLSCCNFKIDSSVCWTITMQSQAHRLVA